MYLTLLNKLSIIHGQTSHCVKCINTWCVLDAFSNAKIKPFRKFLEILKTKLLLIWLF